jgi:Pyruvate:ferredoxin oxidoreductase and related 2-oxoacid:ferredoxin oxidoreductases, gamma subunit
MSNNTTSAVLVGVGGQGTILVSRILTSGLAEAGYEVKMSEIHGMSQRGGSVSTHVRWGDKLYSPVIGKGSADILVAFEKIEALRYADLLKPQAVAVINDYKIDSSTTAAGLEEYPGGVLEAMQRYTRCYILNAEAIAEGLGNPKCMNVVLFGAMAKVLGLEKIDWERIISAVVPAKLLDLNLRAYRAGREAVQL